MRNFLQRLTSRKFLSYLGAVLVSGGAALQGEITIEKAVSSIITLTIAYIATEGLIDISRIFKDKGEDTP